MKTVKKWMGRMVSGALSLALLAAGLAGCGNEPAAPTEETIPADYVWAAYDGEEDTPFLSKDIYKAEMMIPGIAPGAVGSGVMEVTGDEGVAAVVVKGEFGKCYEVKIPKTAGRVLAARMPLDPALAAKGDKLVAWADYILFDKENMTEDGAFMYTCRTQGENLVVAMTGTVPIYIGERTILQDTDVADNWYIPESVGSIAADCTWGDVAWTSEEFLNNLYEPVRQRYPDYITRTPIGKDQSGQYEMYGYVYAPKDYETTMFLSGGTHGDEFTGYFALAKVMQLIADAKPEDTLLYTLRQKVRFVVIPVVNVYSISTNHVRKNSTGTDLNRDFGELTQQESKNVLAFFEQYAGEARILMDFHISTTENVSVYFNFINYSDNSVANYKTTNHMYHRYMELGYAVKNTNMTKIPGSYTKSDKYLEGRIWNEFGVPTITVEYVTNSTFPDAFSSEAMTLAVETYMNFVIQNGLFFLANP